MSSPGIQRQCEILPVAHHTVPLLPIGPEHKAQSPKRTTDANCALTQYPSPVKAQRDSSERGLAAAHVGERRLTESGIGLEMSED